MTIQQLKDILDQFDGDTQVQASSTYELDLWEEDDFGTERHVYIDMLTIT